jgi:hypothetical protein
VSRLSTARVAAVAAGALAPLVGAAFLEFYATLDEAERARRDAISDEPTWVNDLAVVEVELGSSSSN